MLTVHDFLVVHVDQVHHDVDVSLFEDSSRHWLLQLQPVEVFPLAEELGQQGTDCGFFGLYGYISN